MKLVSTRIRGRSAAMAVALTLSTTGLLLTPGAPASAAASGSMTVVVVNQTWASLDPVLDSSGGIVPNQMNAIYGQLFERGPKDQLIPDLATSYKYSNGNKTFTVTIRQGVTFQDGTPFNAAAVAMNIKRDLNPKNACGCLGDWEDVTSVKAAGNKVVMQLSQPNAALPQAFIAEAPNWIASPAALAKEGSSFATKPVGAGPWSVVSNTPSAQLVLKAFPNYWQAGHPSIENLTFLNTSSDQAAYASLQGGQAQMLIGVSTASILNQAKAAGDVLHLTPSSFSYQINFKTLTPPFNNLKARQAVAYATNAAELLNVASPGYGAVTQEASGPGALYYNGKIGGYIHYDLAKAKALVKQLGGLSVILGYGTNIATYVTGAQATATEWEKAGIKVKLSPSNPVLAQQGKGPTSGASFAATGAVDPVLGAGGLTVRYGTGGEFTCCANKTVDKLIRQALVTVNKTKRGKTFSKLFTYLNKQTLTIPLFSQPTAVITSKSVTRLQVAPNFTPGKDLIRLQDLKLAG